MKRTIGMAMAGVLLFGAWGCKFSGQGFNAGVQSYYDAQNQRRALEGGYYNEYMAARNQRDQLELMRQQNEQLQAIQRELQIHNNQRQSTRARIPTIPDYKYVPPPPSVVPY